MSKGYSSECLQATKTRSDPFPATNPSKVRRAWKGNGSSGKRKCFNSICRPLTNWWTLRLLKDNREGSRRKRWWLEAPLSSNLCIRHLVILSRVWQEWPTLKTKTTLSMIWSRGQASGHKILSSRPVTAIIWRKVQAKLWKIRWMLVAGVNKRILQAKIFKR